MSNACIEAYIAEQRIRILIITELYLGSGSNYLQVEEEII